MDVRNASGPEFVTSATTEDLRARFLLTGLFTSGEVNVTYTHEDRLLIGGAIPLDTELRVGPFSAIPGEHLLANREIGVLNVGGGRARILVDGDALELGHLDLAYVGRGERPIAFASLEPANPAQLYFVSTTAHRECPNRVVRFADLEPTLIGSAATSSSRRLYKHLHPTTVDGAQLMMGVTVVDEGSVWNTMPPHTHTRRTEAYFYFGLPPEARVLHLMGEPHATRHLIIADRQAVVSPSWSIHAGAGTASYSFCWAMGGENRVYEDLDAVALSALS